jgi:hypothetical protein
VLTDRLKKSQLKATTRETLYTGDLHHNLKCMNRTQAKSIGAALDSSSRSTCVSRTIKDRHAPEIRASGKLDDDRPLGRVMGHR